NTANEVLKLELLMKRCGIAPTDRPVVNAAINKSNETQNPAVAMEMPDGTIVTGKTSDLLGASSACLLNALKYLAGIDKEVEFIGRELIEPIQHLKVDHMGNHNPRLHTDETLIALAICAATDERAAKAMDMLNYLDGCDAHSSVILSKVDENLFRRLGVNISYEPVYQTRKLYHR
ncbi:MAG: DUF1846 family protein, partial [Firmicutes bacterium]|nr:DUF1846 family protein [Bacillota bacterium]